MRGDGGGVGVVDEVAGDGERRGEVVHLAGSGRVTTRIRVTNCRVSVVNDSNHDNEESNDSESTRVLHRSWVSGIFAEACRQPVRSETVYLVDYCPNGCRILFWQQI